MGRGRDPRMPGGEPMKICFLVRVRTYGGAERQLVVLAERECLGQQARQICERHSIGSILERWDKLFAGVLRGAHV